MPEVIAEIGINHNGDIQNAWNMIIAAKAAGAHYVKFQKRNVDVCYTPEELSKPCESPWGTTVGDKVRGRELSWNAFRSIADKCDIERIGWSSSCFDLVNLRELEEQFGERISFHKVPSAMAKHGAFLRQVAAYGRLTLISVGLAESLEEIHGVAWIFEQKSCSYILNVTTALYPTPVDRCHIARISALLKASKTWANCRGIGYSGHEVGILPSIIAAVLGASYIERHFTLDRSWYGADQSASLEPEGLRRLCRDVSQIPDVIGLPEIHLCGDEKNPVPNLREDVH